MNTKPFSPGFRISKTDSFVLIAGSIGAGMAAQIEWWMGMIIAFVVGHFFLFCNVFRVARPLEMAWATLFTTSAGSTIVMAQPGWPITFAATLAATVVVIVMQMRNPAYHGVAWQTINPGLPQWWAAQGGATTEEKP